jgi:hypothetical protein
MALTKKQQAFVAAYCDDPRLSQAEAARKAGFSIARAKITGHELMRNPEVKREIDRQLAGKLERIETQVKTGEVTRESLCGQLDAIVEECTSAGAGAWQMQNRVKAIELKAKLYGLLTEKVELGLDEKLIELLEAGRKRAGLVPIAPATVIETSIKGELVAGH